MLYEQGYAEDGEQVVLLATSFDHQGHDDAATDGIEEGLQEAGVYPRLYDALGVHLFGHDE